MTMAESIPGGFAVVFLVRDLSLKPDLAVKAPVVEPVDVLGDGDLDVGHVLPAALGTHDGVADALGLEQRFQRLGHRVQLVQIGLQDLPGALVVHLDDAPHLLVAVGPPIVAIVVMFVAGRRFVDALPLQTRRVPSLRDRSFERRRRPLPPAPQDLPVPRAVRSSVR